MTDDDLRHLERCIDLAEEALNRGDEPFGSILVDEHGVTRAEARNEVNTQGDETRHPEFELARWAAANLTAEERSRATVYTSGEHCPMCAAAHGWVGLGPIVYAASAQQLTRWRAEWGRPSSPVRAWAVADVVPALEVRGPEARLEARIKGLHALSD